jgi:hypothetical protein
MVPVHATDYLSINKMFPMAKCKMPIGQFCSKAYASLYS